MTDNPGFWDTLWALVPLGVAGAFSWMPVTGVVVLLLARSGLARVWAFVVGRIAGLALITLAFVAGAQALPTPRSTPVLEGPWWATAEAAVGLALVVVGIVAWVRRDVDRRRVQPQWQRRLAEASVPVVLLTSVVVNLQPKGLVLGLAAGVVVRAGSMPLAESVLAVVVYLVVASLSVLLPVLATYVAPVRTERWLREGSAWVATHGLVITAAVAALVGVVLVVDALGRY